MLQIRLVLLPYHFLRQTLTDLGLQDSVELEIP